MASALVIAALTGETHKLAHTCICARMSRRITQVFKGIPLKVPIVLPYTAYLAGRNQIMTQEGLHRENGRVLLTNNFAMLSNNKDNSFFF
jgi:hypothetical protein